MRVQETFQVKHSLQLENSFGTLKAEDDITLEITMGIKDDEYGWFEFYDIESGGEEWYAEGGLSFNNKELIDYDGVFSLPSFVSDKLKEWGFDVSYVED